MTGDHGSLLDALVRRLSSRDHPELGRLGTRDSADPTMALLDAWAVVGDVLSFYQERIADEGYLRTATERRSLVELGALVGYRPRPGVAASTHVALTIDETITGSVDIPAGTRIQSVPLNADQVPEIFETSEPLQASGRWNTMHPALVAAQDLPAAGDWATIWLRGRQPVRVGDRILVGSADQAVIARSVAVVGRVAYRDNLDLTGVDLVVPVGQPGQQQRFREVAAARGAIDQVIASAESQGGALVGDVGEMLRTLQPLLDAGAEPDTVLDAARRVIAITAARLPPGAHRVEQWCRQARDRLRPSAMGTARGAGATRPAEPPGTLAGSAVFVPPPSPDRLLTLARTPPSRQPARLSHLTAGRTPADVLAPGGSDGGRAPAAAVEVLRRDSTLAARAVTAALSDPVATGAGRLEVSILAVRAAPFGAAAPLVHQTTNGGSVHDPVAASTLYIEPLPEPSVVAAERAGGSVLDGLGLRVTVDRPGMADDDFTFSADDLEDGVTIDLADVGRRVAIRLQGIAPAASERASHELALTIDGQELVLTEDDIGPGGHRLGDLTVVGFPQADLVEVPLLPAPFALNAIALDARYDEIVAGQPAIVDREGDPSEILLVTAAAPVGVAAFGQSGTVTVVTFDGDWIASPTDLAQLRRVTVRAVPRSLPVGPRPVPDPVSGRVLVLDGLYEDLRPGQQLIVEGPRLLVEPPNGDGDVDPGDIDPGASDPGSAALTGLVAAERAMVANVRATTADGRTLTEVELAEPLAYTFARADTIVWGNVVGATHGERRHEALGDGDAARPFQRFALRSGPLTYLPSAAGTGAATTLEVAVNGLRWREASDLAGSRPHDRHYVTEERDGTTYVTFGDGVNGARPPSGTANIEARYRVGLGAGGNLEPGQLSLLVDLPRGAREVVNPLPATGGVDADPPAAIRGRIPLALRALDRLVSTSDYADFAAGYAGIGKARVDEGADGRMIVTVAPAADVELSDDSELVRGLSRAVAERGDPSIAVDVVRFERLLLFCGFEIGLEPDRYWEDVEPDIRSALITSFGFERRDLAQSADPERFVAVAAGVAGVESVRLEVFDAVPTARGYDEVVAGIRRLVYDDDDDDAAVAVVAGSGRSVTGSGLVVAEGGRLVGGAAVGAQLLYLSDTLADSVLLRPGVTSGGRRS